MHSTQELIAPTMHEREQKTSTWLADRAHEAEWREDLPEDWRAQVVRPAFFVQHKEYEIAAERVIGYETEEEACYCRFRAEITEWCTDEEGDWCIVPLYGEHLSAWRLIDDRWLVLRRLFHQEDGASSHAFFSFSEEMPK